MKEHSATGVTLSMKNVYGTTPITIYGQDAGVDEPSIRPHGGRGNVFHFATRLPSKSAPQQIDMSMAQGRGFRLPRIVSELNSARPVHLAIIDGIKTATGGRDCGRRGQGSGEPRRHHCRDQFGGHGRGGHDGDGIRSSGGEGGRRRLPGATARCYSANSWESASATSRRNEILGVPVADVIFSYRPCARSLVPPRAAGGRAEP